jgi:Glycosyltransferase family 92
VQVAKTLDYYVELGVVTVIDWNLPIDDKLVWYRGQLVAINDCLYRSMHAFAYISFNDIDEFVVPHQHNNLPTMIESLQHTKSNVNASEQPFDKQYGGYCGYSFQSTFFDPMLSSPTTHVLYDLESDLRTKAFSKVRTKVIVKPSAVFEVGIHHVSRPLVNPTQHLTNPAAALVGSSVLHVDTNVAYVHHYRKCSSEFDYKMNCQVYVRDDGLSRFIPALRHSVHQTLWILKDKHDKRQLELMRHAI